MNKEFTDSVNTLTERFMKANSVEDYIRCSFAPLDKKGKVLLKNHVRVNAPCYASFSAFPKGVHYILIRDNPTSHTTAKFPKMPPFMYEYADWLANHSIFADAFFTKDAKTIVDSVRIMNGGGLCARYVTTAALMARYIGEKPDTLEMWDIFRKYMDPMSALIISGFFDKREKLIVYKEYNCGGHSFFMGSMKVARLMIEGEIPNLNKYNKARDSMSYYRLNKIFTESDGDIFSQSLSIPKVSVKMEKSGWSKYPVNNAFEESELPELCKFIAENHDLPIKLVKGATNAGV